MALTSELQSLKDFQCENGKCVLSVYLNTDPAHPDQQKGEWKIRLKNGLKRLDEYLEASGDKEEHKSYKKLKKKVNDEILGNRMDLQKSVVIFASDQDDLWSVHYLQVPVETSFHWESQPELSQLDGLQQEYPLAGVILPNLDEVKVIETSLGEVHDEKIYEFDSGKEEWRVKEGLASSDRTASGATHVDDFNQRYRENLSRFYKKMAGNVEQLKKEKNWSGLYLVGETEMIRSFATNLRTKPSGTVNKNLNNSQSSKVLNEVFK
ncbi:VLRF1 family aeRF1-type release factor [Salipaludibacillus sp. CF4.18]|uniref:VLRF1 family aeRF1-type release factor n=1 Tax=Salipaludibacillus sp. CF4.18 TaxID=3373081 RepID=UPI003EE564E8